MSIAQICGLACKPLLAATGMHFGNQADMTASEQMSVTLRTLVLRDCTEQQPGYL